MLLILFRVAVFGQKLSAPTAIARQPELTANAQQPKFTATAVQPTYTAISHS